MKLATALKQKAAHLGFDITRITTTAPVHTNHIDELTHWLDAGHAAEMTYMHANFHKRIEPANLMPGAQSVIVVGLNCTPPETQQNLKPPGEPAGNVAMYACYEDYHRFIKKQLRQLALFLSSQTGPGLKFKICVDSAPLAERALAQRAGLGFIGRNHMLINPSLGPNILLGELITSIQLTPDNPLPDTCSQCDKCINACPTGALNPDGTFHAEKCISYLTIEHKSSIPPQFAEKMDNHLFGCDRCVLACPYHRTAPARRNTAFKYYPERRNLPLQRILDMSPAEFKTEFADSPFLHSGLEILQRNAEICLENAKKM